jgi:DNA (cytosine-5)-methyltransferase 1
MRVSGMPFSGICAYQDITCVYSEFPNAEITAIESNPKIAKVYQQLNPKDNVVIEDAHQYLLNNYEQYDFIWSSPPCQSHSKMVKATRHKIRKYPDMSLYQEIIFLQNFFKGKWVVECLTGNRLSIFVVGQ